MISRWLWVISLAVGAAHADDHRTFDIATPAIEGVYRIRPTAAMSDAWAVDQLQQTIVADSDGKRVACEIVGSYSAVAFTVRQRAVSGHWIDAPSQAALEPVAGFDFRSVWAFEPPALEDGETATQLALDWQSPTHHEGEAGHMQVVARAGAPHGQQLGLQAALMAGNRQHAQVDLRSGPSVSGQIRFARPSLDLSIEQVTLTTKMPKPWAREAVDGPGWILFVTDARPPYRVQFATTGRPCSGVGAISSNADVSTPDWPPEIRIVGIAAGAARLDDATLDIPVERERMLAEQSKRTWIQWALWMTFGFVVACVVLLVRDDR